MALLDIFSGGGGTSGDFTDKPSEEDQKRALKMAILNAGAGILANNYGHYGNIGPALGAGMQNGLLSYNYNYEKGQTAAAERRRTKAMQDALALGIGRETIPGKEIPGYALGGLFSQDKSTADMMAGQSQDINSMMAQPPSMPPRSVETIPYQRAPVLGSPLAPKGNFREPLTEAELGLGMANPDFQYQPMAKSDSGYAMSPLTAMGTDVSNAPQNNQSFTPEPTQLQAATMKMPDQLGGNTFDPRKAAMAMMQSGDPALMAAGFKLMSEAPKGLEFGTTPWVDANGNAWLVGKNGQLVKTGLQGAQKDNLDPNSVREYQFAQKQGYKGSYEQWLDAQNNARATKVQTIVNPALDPFKNEQSLRKEAQDDPLVKSAAEMNGAFKLIATAYLRPSPANDLAMATKYMKILDPTSVVRESELAMAMNATGLIDKVYNYANMIKTGEKLNPNQRKDFYESARAINNAFQEEAGKVKSKFRGIASQYGLKPENVATEPNQSNTQTIRKYNPATGRIE